MKNIKYLLLTLLAFISISQTCLAEGLVTEILHEIEKRNKLEVDLTAKVSVVTQRIKQGVREFEFLYHKRDSDDSFMFVYLSPEREKGNGTLRVEDNIWWYRRNTRTFQHMSRSDRIGDTGITAEDLETRKLTELYAAVTNGDGEEIYTEEMLGKIPVYRFEIKAIVKDVRYPKHIYWVRKDNYLLLKQDSFSLSDTLMQTSYYLKYTNIKERYIPLKFMVVDQFEKGNKDIIDVSGISLKPLDNAVFTKPYLENLSK